MYKTLEKRCVNEPEKMVLVDYANVEDFTNMVRVLCISQDSQQDLTAARFKILQK